MKNNPRACEAINCVVPISGGKDSQACLQLAIDSFGVGSVAGLFCDTQFEHPKTYEHIEWMRGHYGVPIHRITEGSVPDQIRKYKKFPSGCARFCTYNLKLAASRDWYLRCASLQGKGFEVWIGVRWAESAARKKRYANRAGDDLMPLHEFMPKNYPKKLEGLGVTARLPILDWSTQDVFEYLGGKENPLYSEGFDRVGCFPCLAAGDKHKERAFQFDDVGAKHLAVVRGLEPIVGRSVFTSKGGQQRNDSSYEGCAMCAI